MLYTCGYYYLKTKGGRPNPRQGGGGGANAPFERNPVKDGFCLFHCPYSSFKWWGACSLKAPARTATT